MGFLKRVLGGGDDEAASAPGPAWAAPMGREEADGFLAAVDAELTNRGLPHTMGEGRVRIERHGQSNEYGLSNLAQLCHQVGRARWSDAIGEHFDNLFAATDADAELRERARDFEAIQSILKVRLYSGASLGGMQPNSPASWELAPGLTAAFVYDLPTTVSTADADQVAGWGRDHEELLAVALDNVRADPVETQAMGAITAAVGDHFFAASHALLLGERLPPEAGGQAVFAVPHRHALLYAPMVNMGVVQGINQLIVSAVSMFQEGPGSISPGLYWWREGSVSLLPAQFDGRNVQFEPPDEFVQVLNRLATAS